MISVSELGTVARQSICLGGLPGTRTHRDPPGLAIKESGRTLTYETKGMSE